MYRISTRSLGRKLINVILILATLLFVPGLQAEVDVGQVRVLSPHRDLFDLTIDRGRWITVGALGGILESGDEGRTWVDRSLDTPLALLAVDADGGQAVAVGQMGLVAIRSASGWAMHQAPTEERLFSVATEHKGLSIAVGAFGTIITSKDAGNNWRPVDLDWMKFDPAGNEPHLYDVHLERNHIMVVGEFGLVLESTDGGASWRLVRRGDESLFALHVSGEMTYAVGQNGIVIRNRGPNLDWEQIQTGVVANLLGIAQRNDSKDFIVTGMRAVLRSSDGGDSWTAIEADDFSRSWYGDASWSGSMNAFVIVGGGGQIKRVARYK